MREVVVDVTLAPIEVTLRRVVVWFRLLGFAWLLGLVIATLASDDTASRGWVVAALAAATLGTAGMVVGYRRGWIDQLGWVAVDGVLAIFVVLGPGLSGSADLFFGGYPLTWLIYVAYARPTLVAGATAVALLVGAQVVTNALSERSLTPTDVVGDVAVWIVSGAVYGWAMWALRHRDERRVAAETALAEERLRRKMADDRAEIAAHLHDSVLQTLALVQHDAEDPTRVASLARGQELELRRYLDEIASPHESSLRAELRAAAADVEERFGVRMDVVVVGDTEVGADGTALVAAAREAMRNAAKYAGVDEVSVYAEIRDASAQVFVRDRGTGFSPAEVGDGHRGITESIVGRMQRNGGSAEIRSAPGKGTEVELSIGRGEA